jgi:hypothetical protein
LPGNRNWFPVADFVAAVDAHRALEPVLPLGTRVRSRPSGWDSPDRDEAGPALEGIPEWISGELEGWPVEVSDQGIRYFKHIVAGVDIDPKTIEPIT